MGNSRVLMLEHLSSEMAEFGSLLVSIPISNVVYRFTVTMNIFRDFSTAKISILFLFLIAVMSMMNIAKKTETAPSSSKGPSKGFVTNLDQIPPRNTVHVDEKGRPVTKQQLLEPFVLPNLVGFSIATFLPGQTMMPVHEHVRLFFWFHLFFFFHLSHPLHSSFFIHFSFSIHWENGHTQTGIAARIVLCHWGYRDDPNR